VPSPLPLALEPMLAQLEPGLPQGDGWQYEPKWDGFRVLVHRSGERVDMVSRGGRPMTRYFPELLAPLRALDTDPYVFDGEIIVAGDGGLDFDALLQRVHPAESRIRLLSETTPAWVVAFDVLYAGEEDLRALPLRERRRRLESLLEEAAAPVYVTPCTTDPGLAADWFEVFEGAGLDGVIAKRLDQAYLPGKRGWVKVKHERTADCVVIGYRTHKDGDGVGSLLLGVYDAGDRLHYIGHTSSFSARERRELLERLKPMRVETEETSAEWPGGRWPGGQSRWSRGRGESDWNSIRPELVCEVSYDKLQSGERFRHAATFRRWRPDKPPSSCGFDQIFTAAEFDVHEILASG
jgi:ATP-dependent DNA ligase